MESSNIVPIRRRRLDLILLSTTWMLAQQFAGALSSEGYLISSRRKFPNSNSGNHNYQQQQTTPAFLRQTTTHLHQAFLDDIVRSRNGTEESSWNGSSVGSEKRSSPLKVRKRVKSAFQKVRSKTSRLYQSADDKVETWSRSGSKESSLGVRKRVKAVLKKAKNRTGVSNSSDNSPGLWIAESASIGGLSEASDLIMKPKNGKSNGSSSSSLSEEKVSDVDDFELQKTSFSSSSSSDETKETESYLSESSEYDGMRGDVPTPPPEPLPFQLPNLNDEQKKILLNGERVQEQSKMGREGSGFVVMDVKSPDFIIWEALLDFEAYPQYIKTVRDMEMFSSNKLTSGYHSEKPMPAGTTRETRHYGIPSVTRAAFILSKFRLNIAAIHKYQPHPDGDFMVFTLDPDCTNIVLQSATGIWFTQSNPDGRGEEYTRVWLLCELKVSPILPKFIVDYTAKRAMPRATTWLKPHVEPLAEAFWNK